MTLPIRNKESLLKQANLMLKNIYEQVNSVNLYGFIPQDYKSQAYKKAMKKCLSICDKYGDIALKKTYEENFTQWKNK